MPCPYDDIKSRIQISYSGEGSRIAREFYIPVLKRSKRYNRASGYFSIESLVITAAGLAGLIKNNGSMRLIVGAHDLGPEIVEAMELSKNKAEDILKTIGDRIANGLDTVEDIFQKRRLEAIAWMLANDTLEIRVALPKRTFLGRGNGIFHEKGLIMEDEDGCTVQVAGSANETRMAYELNGENLTIHMSWRPGADEYIVKGKNDYNAIWEDKHPDYFTFTLPDAIKKKLHERYYKSRAPIEPFDLPIPAISKELSLKLTQFIPIAKMVSVLGNVEGLAHLGLGPVRLYPHQAFAADYATLRFPHRMLLADEVGLGKTLEAGAVIKRMVDSKEAERILILAPKNVTRQWMEEMWDHFRLRFWLLKTSPSKHLIDALDNRVPLRNDENPFNKPGIDYIVASWHYVRMDDPKRLLLNIERSFDLIIIDEAHAARKKRSDIDRKVQPTKMNELAMEVGIATPHLLLLTATPVQLRAIESHDLLRILGLGGRWAVESEFERYFAVLKKSPEDCTEDEFLKCFQLASEFVRSHLPDEIWKQIVNDTMSKEIGPQVIRAVSRASGEETVVGECIRKNRKNLMKLLMEFNPVQWFMVRNTRSKLEAAGFQFPERKPEERNIPLDHEHQEILNDLDDYLNNDYAAYEKLISPENRGTIGFVHSIYHQRFVSCFTAAQQTLTNRLEFISGLLSGDEEALHRAAEKLLDEEDLEEDEEDVLEAIKELIGNSAAEKALRKEEAKITGLLQKLEPYALGNITGTDPKLKVILHETRQLVSNNRAVLIFTKYSDTVKAIKEYFLHQGIDPKEMAVYTGEGGLLCDKNDCFYSVTKEEVRKALDDGEVSIILCTDAASEGLNLQAASAIINVDMPWNPSRVEQRIGRIDRLGQKEKKVIVLNAWYPDSIEARMYRVLFERRQIYKLVVGPAQELFSNGLRKVLDEARNADRMDEIIKETFDEIDKVKEDLENIQKVLSGRSSENPEGIDEHVVELLDIFTDKACDILGLKIKREKQRLYISSGDIQVPEDILAFNGASLVSGKPNALTPAHPIIQWLCETIINIAGTEPKWDRSIYLLKDQTGIGKFYITDEDASIRAVDLPEALEILEGYLEELP